MKFETRAGPLLKALEPVFEVATRRGDMSCSNTGYIRLQARPHDMLAIADNGWTSIRQTVSDMLVRDLSYRCISTGGVNLDADLLRAALRRFDRREMLSVWAEQQRAETRLVLARLGDPEASNSMPVDSNHVVTFTSAPALGNGTLVKRSVFLRGIERICSAIRGWDLGQGQCVAILASANSLRVVAGNGRHAAVAEFEGDDVLPDASEPTNVIITRGQAKTLRAVLSANRDPYLSMMAQGDERLHIVTNDTKLLLRHVGAAMPAPGACIDAQETAGSRFVIDWSEWQEGARGIRATLGRRKRKKGAPPHVTHFAADFVGGTLAMAAQGDSGYGMQMVKKMRDHASVQKRLTFSIETKYVINATRHVQKNNYVQIDIPGMLGADSVALVWSTPHDYLAGGHELMQYDKRRGVYESFHISLPIIRGEQ